MTTTHPHARGQLWRYTLRAGEASFYLFQQTADFFDGSSLGVEGVLRELIASEEPRHRFSDDELARILSAHSIPMARRTVTKYREEMGILSSRER